MLRNAALLTKIVTGTETTMFGGAVGTSPAAENAAAIFAFFTL